MPLRQLGTHTMTTAKLRLEQAAMASRVVLTPSSEPLTFTSETDRRRGAAASAPPFAESALWQLQAEDAAKPEPYAVALLSYAADVELPLRRSWIDGAE